MLRRHWPNSAEGHKIALCSVLPCIRPKSAMPLRCLDHAGKDIHSFDLSTTAWLSLKAQNQAHRHLRMPCCSAYVTLRKSKLGTQHFAHKRIGECTTAPETETHLRLKRLAVETARECGWTARTEVSGSSEDGERWQADVLAEKGTAKVAIEIQWSPQTHEETLRRQQRYARSGVRGLWLINRKDMPNRDELPIAQILAADGDDVSVRLTSRQQISARDFLSAAFNKRLRFGYPENFEARVELICTTYDCWSCGCETLALTLIRVTFGPYEEILTLASLDEHSGLATEILSRLPHDIGLGQIKTRYSKTMEQEYLSNGCAHCDALLGRHFEHDLWYDGEVVASFTLPLKREWRWVFDDPAFSPFGWAVF